MTIREMQIQDYEEIYAMWQITSKRALSGADSRDAICRYLKRNPGLSQVAVEDGKIVGPALAGQARIYPPYGGKAPLQKKRDSQGHGAAGTVWPSTGRH